MTRRIIIAWVSLFIDIVIHGFVLTSDLQH